MISRVADLPAEWDGLADDIEALGTDAKGDRRVAATLRTCADALRVVIAREARL